MKLWRPVIFTTALTLVGFGCRKEEGREAGRKAERAGERTSEELGETKEEVKGPSRSMEEALERDREKWNKAAEEGGYEIEIGPGGRITAMSRRQPVAGAPQMSDAELKEKVEQALAESDKADVKGLTVEVGDNTVTLRGKVDGFEAAEDAVKRAIDVEGVQRVNADIDYVSGGETEETPERM